MAAQFVANLIRLKEEGFKPDRDLILALTADEEGGTFNGVDWLVKNHRDLIDAEFAINEGGGGDDAQGQVPDQRGPGEREGVPGLPPRGDQRGRPQLAAGQGQRDLSPVGGLARLAKFEFPVELNEVTRGYFERSATVQTDPKMAADMRAVARPTPDLAAAARLSASLPYYNAHDADDVRRDAAARAATRTTRCRRWRRANVNCRILPGVSPGVGQGQARRGAGRSEDQRVVCRRRQPEQAVAAASRRR